MISSVSDIGANGIQRAMWVRMLYLNFNGISDDEFKYLVLELNCTIQTGVAVTTIYLCKVKDNEC